MLGCYAGHNWLHLGGEGQPHALCGGRMYPCACHSWPSNWQKDLQHHRSLKWQKLSWCTQPQEIRLFDLLEKSEKNNNKKNFKKTVMEKTATVSTKTDWGVWKHILKKDSIQKLKENVAILFIKNLDYSIERRSYLSCISYKFSNWNEN